MATLDDLAARLDRLEQLLREGRPPSLPSGRTEVTNEIRAALAAGQKGMAARLDDVSAAISDGTSQLLGSMADLAAAEYAERSEIDFSPILAAFSATSAELEAQLGEIRARLGRDPGASIDALSARVGHLEHAVADAIRATPRIQGALAGLPELLAEPLESIENRLGAVERMAREQFELDQRLGLVDNTLQELVGPFNELLPNLRQVAGIAEWLGRMEDRLQSVATQLSPLVMRNAELGELTGLVDRLGDAVAALPPAPATAQEPGSVVEDDDEPSEPLSVAPDVRLDEVLLRLDRVDEVLIRLDQLDALLARPGPLHEVLSRLDRLDEAVNRTPEHVDEPGRPPELDEVLVHLDRLEELMTRAVADSDRVGDTDASLATVGAALRSLGDGVARAVGPFTARVAEVEDALTTLAGSLLDDVASVGSRLDALANAVAGMGAAGSGAQMAALAGALSPIEARLGSIEAAVVDRGEAPADLSIDRVNEIGAQVDSAAAGIAEQLTALQSTIRADIDSQVSGLRATLNADIDSQLTGLRTTISSSAEPQTAPLSDELVEQLTALPTTIRADIDTQLAGIPATIRADIDTQLAGLRDTIRVDIDTLFVGLRTTFAADIEAAASKRDSQVAPQPALDALSSERLASIEQTLSRLAAPLDARLQRLETTMTASSAPVEARLARLEQAIDRISAPLDSRMAALEHAGEQVPPPLTEQLQRIESQLDAQSTERIGAAIGDAHDALAATVERAIAAVAEQVQGVVAQSTTSAVSGIAHDVEDTRQRLLDLDRKIGSLRADLADDDRMSRSVFQAAQAVASMTDAISGIEHRIDAELSAFGRRIDSLASQISSQSDDSPHGGSDDRDPDHLRHRTAETMAQRISHMRDMAAGVGDAARSELRRRRGGDPPELGRGS